VKRHQILHDIDGGKCTRGHLVALRVFMLGVEKMFGTRLRLVIIPLPFDIIQNQYENTHLEITSIIRVVVVGVIIDIYAKHSTVEGAVRWLVFCSW